MAVLDVSSLSKSFGAVTAAADINVRIDEGEIVSVIGSNGAGKTTFINMVTGYLKPNTGTIKYLDKDITGFNPRSVTNMGVRRSFQIAQPFPELTAIDNMLIAKNMAGGRRLSWGRRMHSDDDVCWCMDKLAEYGIEDYAHSVVLTIPQGVRKLLDIAMAMVNDPGLILLDEPTSGVSVEEKFDLMDTVMKVVRRLGAACLFVEHDMEIVNRYANRVIAFYDGRIIADGPTEEVLCADDVKEFVIGTELHRSN